jgi:hypothetical protein
MILESNPFLPENQEPQRPQFLTVLCVLSFIWSGFLLFCLFILLIFSSSIFSGLEKLLVGAEGMPPISEDQQKALQALLDLGPQKFLIMIAVAIIMYMTSLLGVVKMWKLQKWGFYIYAGVNGLALTYDIISGSYFSIILSIAFIGMYLANFRYMTK